MTRGVTAYVIDPEGEYADMARAAGGRVLSPGVPGEGMNPFVIEQGRLRGASPAHRQPEPSHRGDGGRESRRGAKGLPGPRPGGLLRPAPGAHRLPRLLRVPARKMRRETPKTWRGCCGPSQRAACVNLLSDEGDDLLSNEALITVFDLRLLEPELRPAAAMVCTETVWAAAAQDPKPSLLVVDEVWSHHAAPRRRGLHGLHGQACPEAPAGVAVHNAGRPGPPE